jgi:hypothetical protein
MPRRQRTRLALVVFATAVLAALAFAGPASAGRLVITGHDADLHCAGGEPQCHFVSTAVNYVRGGAPDPNKPVLVLDRLNLQMVGALDAAFGSGVVPRQVVDPRSQFAGVPLSTDNYSAILIASDVTCGGCDLNEFGSTPDSDAINARRADIAAFFNAGGGVYANAGASHGDGDAANGADTYYSFLPIPVGGAPVSGPFCLTPLGASIGFEDSPTSLTGCPDRSRRRGTNDDINCCQTHNSFITPPEGSALRVAEIDVGADGVVGPDDVPQTLVAEGSARGGQLVTTLADLPNPVLGRRINVEPVRGRVRIALPRRRGRGAARASQKGLRFVRLRQARQIPVGSFLDTRRGVVRLQSARNRRGARQTGTFNGGVFKSLQSRKRRLRGLTTLSLSGKFRSCVRRGKGAQAQTAISRRRLRRLRGRARGRFRTRGRYSAATVRGTAWGVIDRCDNTLTRVSDGRVAVRDFRRKRTIVVRAGKTYIARAKGAR